MSNSMKPPTRSAQLQVAVLIMMFVLALIVPVHSYAATRRLCSNQRLDNNKCEERDYAR